MRAWCCKCKLNKNSSRFCSCLIPSKKIGGHKNRACQCLMSCPPVFGGNQATTLISFCLFLITFLSIPLIAGTGTESLQFLKIKPSARVASIGDGYVGLADDSNASFYNPAGLARLTTPEISLMHLAYIGETSYEYAAGVIPAGKNMTLGAYVIYLNYGSITKTTEDTSGVYSGTAGAFNPNNIAGGLSIGYKLGESLNVGAGLKYASEDIDGSSVSGIMGDVGVLYRIEGVGIGASLSNIGGNVGSDVSPMLARLGLSAKLSIMSDDDLTLALGGSYILASSKTVESIGAEYCYDNFVSVRGSYGIGYDLNNLNVGAGVKQNLDGMICGLDYNFSLFGDLGSAHRVSLSVKLGEEKRSKRSKNSTNSKYRRSGR